MKDMLKSLRTVASIALTITTFWLYFTHLRAMARAIESAIGSGYAAGFVLAVATVMYGFWSTWCLICVNQGMYKLRAKAACTVLAGASYLALGVVWAGMFLRMYQKSGLSNPFIGLPAVGLVANFSFGAVFGLLLVAAALSEPETDAEPVAVPIVC